MKLELRETALRRAQDHPSLDFVEFLAARAEKVKRSRPKRARTRAQILASAARELTESGYDRLSIDAICQNAGMARGTFYLYFKHRSDVAIAVCRLFWAFVHVRRPRLKGATLRERVAVTNFYYLQTYAKNARLLMAQNTLYNERPDFALRQDEMNHKWALRIAANFSGDSGDSETRILRARALVSMADELLRNIFTDRTPSLAQWATQPERLAECLTDIWLCVAEAHTE